MRFHMCRNIVCLLPMRVDVRSSLVALKVGPLFASVMLRINTMIKKSDK